MAPALPSLESEPPDSDVAFADNALLNLQYCTKFQWYLAWNAVYSARGKPRNRDSRRKGNERITVWAEAAETAVDIKKTPAFGIT